MKHKITQLPNGRTRVVITVEFASDVPNDITQWMEEREQITDLLDSVGPTWKEVKAQVAPRDRQP